MDIEMPGMNGVDFTLMVKKELPEVHIFMFTVHQDEVHIFV